MTRTKSLETNLVLIVALIIFWIVYKIDLLLFIALGLGAISLGLPIISKYIAIGWFRLGKLMGKVVSPILLAIIFYCFLTPLALFFRIFNKDEKFKKQKDVTQTSTSWTERKHDFQGDDLVNLW